MTKVEWVGGRGLEEYHGHAGADPKESGELHLLPGEPVEVSADQAAYLEREFGELVAVGGATRRSRGKKEDPAVEETGPEDPEA